VAGIADNPASAALIEDIEERRVEFSIKQGSPEKLKSGCVVVGVFDGGKLSKAAQVLDKAAKHALSDVIARGDMSGKDRKSTRLNSSHRYISRMPSSA
jgi:hypothetical protein